MSGWLQLLAIAWMLSMSCVMALWLDGRAPDTKLVACGYTLLWCGATTVPILVVDRWARRGFKAVRDR